MTVTRWSMLCCALVMVTACAQSPRPLIAGTDACDFCRMTVTDVRFGGELQSTTGQIRVFDAIECLASYYLDAEQRNDVRAVWVADFETGRLISVDSVVFVRGGRVNSPMGRSLVALSSPAGPAAAKYGGRVMTWHEVLVDLRAKALEPGAVVDTVIPR